MNRIEGKVERFSIYPCPQHMHSTSPRPPPMTEILYYSCTFATADGPTQHIITQSPWLVLGLTVGGMLSGFGHMYNDVLPSSERHASRFSWPQVFSVLHLFILPTPSNPAATLSLLPPKFGLRQNGIELESHYVAFSD